LIIVFKIGLLIIEIRKTAKRLNSNNVKRLSDRKVPASLLVFEKYNIRLSDVKEIAIYKINTHTCLNSFLLKKNK